MWFLIQTGRTGEALAMYQRGTESDNSDLLAISRATWARQPTWGNDVEVERPQLIVITPSTARHSVGPIRCWCATRTECSAASISRRQ